MSKALRFVQITAKQQDFPFLTPYRISNNKNFIPKYLDNALKVLFKLHEHQGDRIGEKCSCERFCKVPRAENHC